MMLPFLNASFIGKAIVVVIAVVVGIASYTYFKLPKDNEVEVIAEDVIKYETGVDINLSFSGGK